MAHIDIPVAPGHLKRVALNSPEGAAELARRPSIVRLGISQAFNPSLIEWRGELLLCYRDWPGASRLWTCPIDRRTLQPADTPVMLQINHPLCAGGREDPRLFIHRDRLHMQLSGVEMRGKMFVHILHA